MSTLDNHCALDHFVKELNKLISGAHGVALKSDIPDKEALELAIRSLDDARALFVMALTAEDVVH